MKVVTRISFKLYLLKSTLSLLPGFNKMKVENESTIPMTANTISPFSSLHTGTLLTPNQILAASQTAAIMAASGIPVSLHATLSSNPNLFHPSLFTHHIWPPSPVHHSPQSPPSSINSPNSPLSPKTRKHNNNNIVSSSNEIQKSIERRKTPNREYTDIMGQLSPPTSGSSPPSGTSPPTSSTGDNQKQFVCGVCNRSFGYKHVLQNHERTHTGEKPFECPECHKRFTRDHHLKTHMRLHTGERPYHCDHCDRHFVQVANLRRHLRVHTGERPYTCKECNSRFSDSNQLKAHLLIHKGEKPFNCDSCHTKFRRRHHLMHHKCSNAPEDLSVKNERYQHSQHSQQQNIIGVPLDVTIVPEQTEPEDLSMSTGHNHSHNGSNASDLSSPSFKSHMVVGKWKASVQVESEEVNIEDVDEDELDEASTLFINRIKRE